MTMRRISYYVSVLVIGAIISVGFQACGDEDDDKGNKEGQVESYDKEDVPATAEYSCPMRCEGDLTYSEPGQCPVCGMDLVKKEEA